MKKLLLFLMITIILLLSCAVNKTTGIIKVENRTNLDLIDVKIGDRFIAGYVVSGSYVNYYYYQEITGALTTGSIPVDERYKGEDFKLKLDWWVYITAKYNSDGDEIVTISAKENNSSDSSNKIR